MQRFLDYGMFDLPWRLLADLHLNADYMRALRETNVGVSLVWS